MFFLFKHKSRGKGKQLFFYKIFLVVIVDWCWTVRYHCYRYMSLIVNAIGVSCAMDFFVYCNQHFGDDFTRDQTEVNLFVTTIFRNQYEEYLINDIPKAFEDWLQLEIFTMTTLLWTLRKFHAREQKLVYSNFSKERWNHSMKFWKSLKTLWAIIAMLLCIQIDDFWCA